MNPVNNVILLAAGDSVRMGQPKALIKIKNKNLLELQIETIRNLGKTPIVVLGKLHQEILKAMPQIQNKALVVNNPHPEHGQFSSLKLGFEKLPHGESTFVLTLDTPAPEPEVWLELERSLNCHQVVVPRYLNKGGHPVLLNNSFIEQLRYNHIPVEDQRLDRQIRKLEQDEIALISVPFKSILIDLDTPEDLENYFRYL